MRVVFKYPLTIGETVLRLPIGSVPLIIGLDPANGQPALWAEREQPKEGEQLHDAVVELQATGRPFETIMRRYVGSVIGHHNVYVWHAYIVDQTPWKHGHG